MCTRGINSVVGLWDVPSAIYFNTYTVYRHTHTQISYGTNWGGQFVYIITSWGLSIVFDVIILRVSFRARVRHFCSLLKKRRAVLENKKIIKNKNGEAMPHSIYSEPIHARVYTREHIMYEYHIERNARTMARITIKLTQNIYYSSKRI